MSDSPGSETLPGSNPPSMSEPCRRALNRAIADQELAWHKGDTTLVEQYLEREPVLRSNADAILDLIYKEVLLRCGRGEKPQLEEYARRFPDLAQALGPIFEVHLALESGAVADPAVVPTQPMPPRAVPETPPDLPGYELLERLGHGGMGVVYKARQKSLGRIVAVKMVLAGAHASPEALARFRHEADAVAKLAHPNIVQIYEIGEHDGRPFLSLEFVAGGSLDRKLAGTPLSARDAARLVEILARAVHHAHLQGVVHRDLKPANILVKDEGGRMKDESDSSSFILHPSSFVPKLTDFGLARLGGGSGQTQSGDILGTPSYMAPEQAAGRNSAIGQETDVYALGATLYEMLTGRPPFRADNPLDTLLQVIDNDPVSLTHLQPNVPRDLETICLKCLQKVPTKRYESAEALAADLQRFLEGKPIHARQTATWERGLKWAKRHPALAGLYALAVASAIALGLYTIWLRDALNETENQRQEARHAQKRAETAAEERRLQLVQARMADGARLLDEGDWFGALLPFADAFKLDEKDAKCAEIHRLRLSLILRQCPRLAQFWPHDADVSHAEFIADGRRVLTAAGNTAQWFDAETGVPIGGVVDGKSITALALSSDGTRIATATDDKSVRIWDTTTGKRVGALLQLPDLVDRIAFNSNGDQLVTAARNAVLVTTIQAWDVATGKPTAKPLTAQTSPASEIALSADGQWAALAGFDKTLNLLTVWDIAAGKPVFIARDLPALMKIRFSPNRARVAAASADGSVRVWDCSNGKELTVVRHELPVLHLAFSPDEKRLAMVGLFGAVQIWEAGKSTITLRHGSAFTHAVAHVAFSPDGLHAVTAGADKTARVWDAMTGTPIAPPLHHGDKVIRASFSRDGRHVLTVSADQVVRVWDLASCRLATPPLEHEGAIAHAAFDKLGRRVVTAGADRVARVWDLDAGRPHGAPLVHKHKVAYAAFNLDGRIVTTSEDNANGVGEASVWDAATGKLHFRRATTQRILGVLDTNPTVHRSWFSPDGRLLLALDKPDPKDDRIAAQVWDVSTGKAVTDVLEHPSAVTGVAFSSDGRQVLTETFLPDFFVQALLASGESAPALGKLAKLLKPTNTVHVWDVDGGKRVATIGPWSDAAALSFRRAAFAYEGRLFLVSNGEARLWDIAENKIVRRFRKPGATVASAALSPDGATLVTACDDETAQLWNADTGALITTPVQFRHGGQRRPPLFSPDGRFVVLTSRPTGVRIWDAATGEPLSPVLAHAVDVESATFSPDGRSLLTASDRAARAWSLKADERSADEWLRLAQLLSGSRLQSQGGPAVPLSADELRSAWNELPRRTFRASRSDVITWHAEAARACEKLNRWAAALPHLETLAELDPERLDLYTRRGRAYAEVGRLDRSAADFEKAQIAAPDKHAHWFRHALVRRYLDDGERYQKIRVAMLDRFKFSEDLVAAQQAAWAGSLGPAPAKEAQRLVAAAQRAVDASPRNHARLLTLGAAQFRASQYAEAVRTLDNAVRVWGKDDTAWDWLYLSMAHHHLGNADLANANFDKAARYMDQRQVLGADGKLTSTLFWSDRLELSLLRMEAESYLRGDHLKKQKE